MNFLKAITFIFQQGFEYIVCVHSNALSYSLFSENIVAELKDWITFLLTVLDVRKSLHFNAIKDSVDKKSLLSNPDLLNHFYKQVNQ